MYAMSICHQSLQNCTESHLHTALLLKHHTLHLRTFQLEIRLALRRKKNAQSDCSARLLSSRAHSKGCDSQVTLTLSKQQQHREELQLQLLSILPRGLSAQPGASSHSIHGKLKLPNKRALPLATPTHRVDARIGRGRLEIRDPEVVFSARPDAVLLLVELDEHGAAPARKYSCTPTVAASWYLNRPSPVASSTESRAIRPRMAARPFRRSE